MAFKIPEQCLHVIFSYQVYQCSPLFTEIFFFSLAIIISLFFVFLGHLVLDADTAHSVFVLSVGAVHPSSVVSVTLQSSRELQTLPGGAVRVTLNSTLIPLAQNQGDPSEHGDGLCDDRLCLW